MSSESSESEFPFPVKHYLITDEMKNKGAARRAKRERKIKAERVATLAYNLRRDRNCAVVAMKGVVVADFLIGIEETFGKEKVLRLPAEGNIQGTAQGANDYEGQELDHYKDVMKQISDHRHEYSGGGLLMFDGVSFNSSSLEGSNLVAQRVTEFLVRQKSTDPMIVLLGHGTPSDLPLGVGYDKSTESQLVQNVGMRYALLHDGELATVMNPYLLGQTDQLTDTPS